MIISVIIILVLLMVSLITIKTRTFHYWFFMVYPFLPDYFALEISDTLPLVSASRIMILFLLVYYLIFEFKKDIKSKQIIPIKFINKHYLFLFFYFLLRIVANLYYVTTLSDAIKAILGILVEQLLLVILLSKFLIDENEILKCIKSLVYASGIVFILAISESFTGKNLADYLYLVSRSLLNDHYTRLGILRAEFTFGIPNYLGMFCVVIVPLVLYLYEKTNQKRFLFILMLDIFAEIYSGCRSDIAILLLILCIYPFLQGRGQFKRRIKLLLIQLCVFLLIVGVLCFSSENMRYYYSGTVKSILNEVGFDFDLDEGAPEGVDGYGVNGEDGAFSRIAQLSGFAWTAEHNWVFGLGANAQNRGEVQYYFKTHWMVSHTYDIGYVAVFCDEGILGILGYFSLFSGVLYTLIKIRKYNKLLLNSLIYSFIIYFICLLSTSNMPNTLWLILSFCICYESSCLNTRLGNEILKL